MPKHADPADYHAATAFEALIGYLYISGQDERLKTLVEVALNPEPTQGKEDTQNAGKT